MDNLPSFCASCIAGIPQLDLTPLQPLWVSSMTYFPNCWFLGSSTNNSYHCSFPSPLGMWLAFEHFKMPDLLSYIHKMKDRLCERNYFCGCDTSYLCQQALQDYMIMGIRNRSPAFLGWYVQKVLVASRCFNSFFFFFFDPRSWQEKHATLLWVERTSSRNLFSFTPEKSKYRFVE